MTDKALAFLEDAVQSNWIAPVGPHVDGFESDLQNLLQTDHVLSTNSGTSAIHLGLLAMGVVPGDEVLCSTFTFCASVTPAMYCGATPVFIDSEDETWNMDPALLEKAIQDRMHTTGKLPKAVVLVHLYGMPAKLDEVIEVAGRYGIPVLEDAAEALGSLYRGKAVGTFGEAGILSFNGNKIITTSAGGALFSNNGTLIEKARYLRQEAKEPLPWYEHKEIGYNYRLSNLLAAVGRSQLQVLSDRVDSRRKNFEFYFRELNQIRSISFLQEPANITSNRWLTTIVVRDARVEVETLRTALAAGNVESRRLWMPMHRQPVFEGYPAYLNGVSDDLFRHGLCLPSGTNLDVDDLGRICEIIRKQFVL